MAGTTTYLGASTPVAADSGATYAAAVTDSDTKFDAAIGRASWYSIFETPSNKTYTIILNARHAGTITDVTTKAASGACTFTVKINGVALGGTANSVTTSKSTQEHASANTFIAGDDISITISSNSACSDLSWCIWYSRTTAGTA